MNRIAFRIALTTFVAFAVLLSGVAATPTNAQGNCPSGADACLEVNTNQDEDARDSVLSLREAMLLDRGDLAAADLTAGESAQVTIATGTGLDTGGIRYIYFDSAIFCDVCSTNTIFLVPPGFGGSTGGSGRVSLDGVGLDNPPGFGGSTGLTSLPPGFGGSTGGNGEWLPLPDLVGLFMPPGFGGSTGGIAARLGMGYDEGSGAEIDAKAVIDGSALDADVAGLRVADNGGWLRNLQFQNFAGTAVQIVDTVESATLVGTNGDGVNDDAEAVTFSNNGTDVEIIASP